MATQVQAGNRGHADLKQKLATLAEMNMPANVIAMIAQCLKFHKSNDKIGAELTIRRAEQAMATAGLEQDVRMAVVYEVHANLTGDAKDVASTIQLLSKALELLDKPDLPPRVLDTKMRLLRQRGNAFALSSRHVEEIMDYEAAAALATDDLDRITMLLSLSACYGSLPDPRAKPKLHENLGKLEAALHAYESCHSGKHVNAIIDQAWETLLGQKHFAARAAGKPDEALHYAREYVAHSSEAGSEAGARSVLAEQLCSMGMTQAALQEMFKTDALLAKAKIRTKLTAYLMQCVDAWLTLRVPEKAFALVDKMEQVLRATTPVQQQSSMLHAGAKARARAYAMMGDSSVHRGQLEQADTLRRRIWDKCSVSACTNSFQANGEKLLTCGACKQAWYCSKECQVADWKAKHKVECKKWKENLTGGAAEHAGAPT